MKKLKLDLDRLAVDTFEPAEGESERGTAYAHGYGASEDAVVGIEGTCGTGPGWTGMDTCEGESCLQTCTFDTCLSCTA
jgi:hypothetical protein